VLLLILIGSHGASAQGAAASLTVGGCTLSNAPGSQTLASSCPIESTGSSSTALTEVVAELARAQATIATLQAQLAAVQGRLPRCTTFDVVREVCRTGLSPSEQRALVERTFGKSISWANFMDSNGVELNYGYNDVVLPVINCTADRASFFFEFRWSPSRTDMNPPTPTASSPISPMYIPIFFRPDDFQGGQVRMDWELQPSNDLTVARDRCTFANWNMHSGPGFNGGYDHSPSWTCPAGLNCVGGSPQNGNDAPITATYENTEMTSATVPEWTGFAYTSYNCQPTTSHQRCACSNNIPTDNMALRFSTLTYERCFGGP